MGSGFPEGDPTAWIIAQRPPRAAVDPLKPYGFFLEEERSSSGKIVSSLGILLTNKECPWHCLMCDLWKHTTTASLPPGAIPTQITHALTQLPPSNQQPQVSSETRNATVPQGENQGTLHRTLGATRGDVFQARQTAPERRTVAPSPRGEGWGEGERDVIPPSVQNPVQAADPAQSFPEQVKLYNSGSFFDPAAIPPNDYPAIAQHLSFAHHVIVESHPRLIGEKTLRLRDLLSGSLEVAIGLETVHPDVLPRLNKKSDLTHFARAADFLRKHHIALRSFVLVKPPFMNEDQALEWALKSADFAFSHGSAVVSFIPVRPGNGAMDRLMESAQFSPPSLAALERTQALALYSAQGRVFADTWDLRQFSSCSVCYERRLHRLHSTNLTQRILPPVPCSTCGNA